MIDVKLMLRRLLIIRLLQAFFVVGFVALTTLVILNAQVFIELLHLL